MAGRPATVPGSTSPLWVLLLAVAAVLGAPLWLAAKVYGVLFLAVAAALAWRLALRLTGAPMAALVTGALTALDGRLLWAAPSGMEVTLFAALSLAAFLARDLINTPSNDMGPAELETVARDLAKRFGAKFGCIEGHELKENFPLIHAVGMASTRSQRLIDFTWGDAAHPKVTLVGKGVCFDTGGLDLKPSSSMLMMKKDMAGGATVLAVVLADLGICAVGTFLGAMAVMTRARDLILPLLFLPLAIPIVVGAVGASVVASPGRYLGFLALYDLLFAVVCWASFEYVVAE